MLKTEKNPTDQPLSVFDGLRVALAANRPQFYKDITLPFYEYNRTGAKISEGIREHWWLQGVLGGVKAHYDCIKAFSETDFTEDFMTGFVVQISRCEGPVGVTIPKDGSLSVTDASGVLQKYY